MLLQDEEYKLPTELGVQPGSSLALPRVGLELQYTAFHEAPSFSLCDCLESGELLGLFSPNWVGSLTPSYFKNIGGSSPMIFFFFASMKHALVHLFALVRKIQ